ncbi:MAG: TerB family tellurite resistance protein [Flammeovirgaceae bacterium]|nr:MAG: TerB family tellurite resistance protein [Flammeovirgaceae bacterium]
MVIHKTFADFVLFLYVHMAHADGEFHETEVKVVKEKMKKLYPNESDYDKKLKEAMTLYIDFDKNQLRTLFRDTFKHFSEVKFPVKYHIYTDLYDIINADGKIDESETDALTTLKEIIDVSH